MGKKGTKKKTIWRALPISEGVPSTTTAPKSSTRIGGEYATKTTFNPESNKGIKDISTSSTTPTPPSSIITAKSQTTSSASSELSNNENRNIFNGTHISSNNNHSRNNYPSSFNKYSNSQLPHYMGSSTNYPYKRRPFSTRNGNVNYNNAATNGTGYTRSSYNSTYKYRTANNYYEKPENIITEKKESNFNEDEYTRITTPRQDVLFKKGYLSKPKKYSLPYDTTTPSSGAMSVVSTEDSATSSMSPENLTNLTPDIHDSDLSPYMYPYVDQNGLLYVNPYMSNSFDPYGGQMILMPYTSSVNCQIPPFNVNPYEYYDAHSLETDTTKDSEEATTSTIATENEQPPTVEDVDISISLQLTSNCNVQNNPSHETECEVKQSDTVLEENLLVNGIDNSQDNTDAAEIDCDASSKVDTEFNLESSTCQYHNEYGLSPYAPMYYPFVYCPPPVMPGKGVDYNSSLNGFNGPYDNSAGTKQFRFKKRKRKPKKIINSAGATTDDYSEDEYMDQYPVQYLLANPVITPVPYSEELVQKSNLSVEVKEFQPRNYEKAALISNVQPESSAKMDGNQHEEELYKLTDKINEEGNKRSGLPLTSKKQKEKLKKVNNNNNSKDLSYASILGASKTVEEVVNPITLPPPSPPKWHTIVKSKGKRGKTIQVELQQQELEMNAGECETDNKISETSVNASVAVPLDEVNKTISSAQVTVAEIAVNDTLLTSQSEKVQVAVAEIAVIDTLFTSQSKKATKLKTKKSKRRHVATNSKLAGFEVIEPTFGVQTNYFKSLNSEKSTRSPSPSVERKFEFSDDQILNEIDLQELEDELDKDFDIIESVSELSSDDNDIIATEVIMANGTLLTSDEIPIDHVNDVVLDVEESILLTSQLIDDIKSVDTKNFCISHIDIINNPNNAMESDCTRLNYCSNNNISGHNFEKTNLELDYANQISNNNSKNICNSIISGIEVKNISGLSHSNDMLPEKHSLTNGFIERETNEAFGNGNKNEECDVKPIEVIEELPKIETLYPIILNDKPKHKSSRLVNGCNGIDLEDSNKTINGNTDTLIATTIVDNNVAALNNNKILLPEIDDESIHCDNKIETDELLLSDNNEANVINNYPITTAVSKWLKEQKEKSPEPILRLPDDPILSSKIHLNMVSWSRNTCPGADDDWTTTDESEAEEEDNNEHHKRPKNLNRNPLHASSHNSSYVLDIADSDYMSDSSQIKYDDDIIACKRVALPRDSDYTINNITNPHEQDITFNLDNKASSTNLDNNIEIYESLYGKTINYAKLISEKDKDPQLSHNICTDVNSSKQQQQLPQQIRNKNNSTNIDNNNYENKHNNTDNCIKSPFTEVCCILM